MEKLSKDEQRVELIQRYLTGELSGAELTEVEAQIANDESFAKEVKKYRFLLDGMAELDTQNLREKMAGWEVKLEDETPPASKSNSFRWYYAAAAIILLLALPLGSRLLFPPAPTAAELYGENFTPFQPDLGSRGDSSQDSLKRQIQMGIAAYHSGNFQKAISFFDLTPQQDSILSERAKGNVYLCLGVSYLNEGQTQKAIESFRQIPAETPTDHNYAEHAIWYMAMAYLKQDESESARVALEKLQDNNFYGERAKGLIEEINRMEVGK